MTPRLLALALSSSLLGAGCGVASQVADDRDLGGDVDGGAGLGGDDMRSLVVGGLPALRVSGTVLAFESQMPLGGSATVSTSGLAPPPTATMSGATFALDGVIPYSVFGILAGAPPSYRTTYNLAPEVGLVDVSGVEVLVVAETTLSSFATACAVTPAAGKAVLFARVVAANGNPVAGIPAAAFQLNGAPVPRKPCFLDASKVAQGSATTTSASAWVVFFDVDPGQVSVTSPAGSGYVFNSPEAPTAANLATVIEVTAAAGSSAAPPTNVSFSSQVLPIFVKRGCVNCHADDGPGKELGGLTLKGPAAKVFPELTVEISPNFAKTRVDKVTPGKSLVLTMPSAESPPDPHPNVTLTGPTDPDYLTLLAWIKEGAKNN